MSVVANREKWIELAVALVLGTVMAAGLWAAGAGEVASVGFLLAAVAPRAACR